MNTEIHTNPDLIASKNLNIDIDVSGIGRVDLKIEKSGCAACVFSKNELLFVRLNGNRVIPRLEGFIDNETHRRLDDLLKSNAQPMTPFIADID